MKGGYLGFIRSREKVQKLMDSPWHVWIQSVWSDPTKYSDVPMKKRYKAILKGESARYHAFMAENGLPSKRKPYKRRVKSPRQQILAQTRLNTKRRHKKGKSYRPLKTLDMIRKDYQHKPYVRPLQDLYERLVQKPKPRKKVRIHEPPEADPDQIAQELGFKDADEAARANIKAKNKTSSKKKKGTSQAKLDSLAKARAAKGKKGDGMQYIGDFGDYY